MLDGNVLLRQKRDEVPEGTLSCTHRTMASNNEYGHRWGLRLHPSRGGSELIQRTLRSEENVDVEGIGSRISDDIGQIIEHSKHAVAVYLNTEVTLTYWRIGRCIANELDAISDEKYGSKIVSTVSRQLTERFGKGYQRANLFRMLSI